MAGASKGQRKRWETMIGLARGCFSVPSFSIFSTLVTGWVLAPGRRTVTGMIGAGDPEGCRAHDAYHRFFRAARWSLCCAPRGAYATLAGRGLPRSTITSRMRRDAALCCALYEAAPPRTGKRGRPRGVARTELGDACEEKGQPAELDVRADAVLAPVEDRPQIDRRLQTPPAPLRLVEGLVAGRDLLGRQGLIGASQQELAVEVGLAPYGRFVDAQLRVLGQA